MNMSENKIINLNDLSKSYAVPEEGETFGKEQSLGLVLTPVHIADLMSKMAGKNKDTIIYDPCSGTGTFLTSTLEEIRKFTTAKVDTHLVGSEIREDIYNVALNNLISHGVSKPHLYNGDCFKLEETVKLHHPTVVLLNPPYEKQKII